MTIRIDEYGYGQTAGKVLRLWGGSSTIFFHPFLVRSVLTESIWSWTGDIIKIYVCENLSICSHIVS